MTILETERLILRAPVNSDAGDIVRQVGDWDVAKNLAAVPFPYAQDDALRFIERSADSRVLGQAYVFAVMRRDGDVLMGLCGLHLNAGFFELGYWYGKEHWGLGYATEAGARVLAFAFDDLEAERLTAGWFHDNPASGRVLAKLGGQPAGTVMRDCLARGEAVYCHEMAFDRADYLAARAA
jgi:RimJ/RimL family protein N-acetyltransferase